jgi:hypothetical protein
MKTNPSMDDELMKSTVIKSTKKNAVILVQTPVKLHKQQSIRDFKGKLQWDGDLELMRTD